MSSYITSPKTGKPIKVGGPTYQKLQNTKWVSQLKKAPRVTAPKSKKSRTSRTNKYQREGIPVGEFCGPAGGAMQYTYPVNTPGRARAALSYARHAPNPEGIKMCARTMAKKKGWMDPVTGKIKQK